MDLLVFALDDARFALPASAVREILRAATFTKVADTAGIEGAIDIRGRVLPVLDLRGLLGLAARQMAHTDHLVVLDVGAGQRGVIRVDRAVQLSQLAEPSLEPQGASETTRLTRCFMKTADGLVHVLDTDALFQMVQMPNWGAPSSAADVSKPAEPSA